MKRLLALLLVLALLLTGCGSLGNFLFYTHADDMEYTRPDPAQVQSALEEVCQAAETADSPQRLVEQILAFYDVYDRFETCYSLSFIHYCRDTTDLYWQEEYDYCSAHLPEVTATLDTLFRTLAQCPLREQLESEEYFGQGFFDSYEGESFYDDTLLALMEQENQLITQYHEISAQSEQAEPYSQEYFTQYAPQLAQLFRDLVEIRQRQAAHTGYDSYPQLAYDLYFYRDYTPQEAETFFLDVQKKMISLFRRTDLSPAQTVYQTPFSQEQTLDYLAQAAQGMGGQIAQAYYLMRLKELYDIAPGPNKYNVSFEVYLTGYRVPYLFASPQGCMNDALTLTHEFGHFANDVILNGVYPGTDVAEVNSQSMEYLSLLYAQDTDLLTRAKEVNCLLVYVEQSAYALFEHQVYDLTGEDLTVENIQALYQQIGQDFGFESVHWDPRDYVMVPHLFMEPLYICSYVFSNDLAFQIYQMEQARAGAGLEVYRKALSSQEPYLRAFAQACGLTDPFDPQRLEDVRAALEPLFP